MKKFWMILLFAGLVSACEKENGAPDSGEDDVELVTTVQVQVDRTVDATRITTGETSADESRADASKGNYHYTQIAAPAGYSASTLAAVNDEVLAIAFRPVDKKTFKGYVSLVKLDAQGIPYAIYQTMEVDGRINALATDGGRLFFGLDLKNGPALAAVALAADGFPAIEQMAAYNVNGVSLNAIYYSTSTGSLYSASGGSGTIDEENADFVSNFTGKELVLQSRYLGRPGYQKFSVGTGSKLTPVCYQGNGNNRGKWIDGKNGQLVCLHYSGNYNASFHNNIQYYVSEDQITGRSAFNKRDVDKKLQVWFNNATFVEDRAQARFSPYDDLLYVCSGHTGLRSYTLEVAQKSATEVGVYMPTATVNPNSAVLAFDFVDAQTMVVAKGNLGVDIVTNEAGQFAKAGKTFRLMQDGAGFSANLVVARGTNVYVSYGRAGVVVYDRTMNTK